MKSISVTDAQGDIDAMIDQVEQEKTYDQITQSIGGEEGGISQTLILALGAVAVAVIGVVAFMLLRKKKTV
jgi:LPXTG-motif cell wall-anchored protein